MLGIGIVSGIFIHSLMVPWLLASALFIVNYILSLFFLGPIARLGTSAAAGLAVVSFMLRFGLLGLGLVAVALALPEYFTVTAICFLVVYTVFFALEIAVGVRGRKAASPPAQGGEA